MQNQDGTQAKSPPSLNSRAKYNKKRRQRYAQKRKAATEVEINDELMADSPVKETKVVASIEFEVTVKLEETNKVNMVHEKEEKTREQILAEREAKKHAKLQAKNKSKEQAVPVPKSESPAEVKSEEGENVAPKTEKSREEIKAEREAKKLAKQAAKGKAAPAEDVAAKLAAVTISEDAGAEKKKPVLSKAERRAIQEAQRAAKADKQKPPPAAAPVTPKKDTKTLKPAEADKKDKSPTPSKLKDTSKYCKVKLFNHLETCSPENNIFVNNAQIHPIMVRLGEQYSKRTVVGSNARCISFLNALKTVVQEFETPPKKEFARSLEATIKNCVDHLHKCRRLAVSVSNAYKHIKCVLTQLPKDEPESDLKERICHFIDTYVENQIGKAAEAISSSVQQKISNGDVILTFGCSSLINYIFEEAHRRHVDFRVIVVDSRPFLEGQELLRRLVSKGIKCTYVLINAVGFIMPEVTKVLLGAHSLLANGYVMARTGTAQVALVARSFNVPVLVCCETHKFSERVQTDAIVYNELGNPDDLVRSKSCRLANWQTQNKLVPLNLNFDVTPPELVTAVVTEVAILPCTSVPVILRIKPTEIGY